MRNTETSRNWSHFISLEMSQLSFNHLLHLSFAWHTKRKTGEVLRILDRGAAINNTFQVRSFLYSYLIVVALTSPGSFCCSKSSPRSLISLWRLSCLRFSLIGRLRSSFSSYCLHTVRSGRFVHFWDSCSSLIQLRLASFLHAGVFGYGVP